MADYYKNGNKVSLAEDLDNLVRLENDKLLASIASGDPNLASGFDWSEYLLQPEIAALKRFTVGHHFVASLYLEGGGLGSLYPSKHRKYFGGPINPDSDVFEKLVAHYWRHNKLKPGNSECKPDLIQNEELSDRVLVSKNLQLGKFFLITVPLYPDTINHPMSPQ